MAFFGLGGKVDGGLKPIVQRAPTTAPAVSSVSALLVQPKAIVRAPVLPPPPPPPAPAPVAVRVEPPKPPPVAPPPPRLRLLPPAAPAVATPKPKAVPPPPVIWGPPSAAVTDLTHLRRAVVLQAKGEHEAAIMEFAKAIALDPHCIEGYAGRGISKEALGDVDGARRDYCKSVEMEVKQGIARHLATAPDLAV